jgi:D-alanyl-lipoteichoic acid acyltransferase DltB (MBOAT superfamily)
VGWIGFSYIAFRLLHVLLERFAERDTGSASPLDMLLYTLFFPALLVGPIDRLPHFLGELRSRSTTFQGPLALEGVKRLLVGGVKKYFFADMLLAPFVLDGTLAPNLGIPLSWLQLYASAFYLLLDFSGSIDIAIGMGLLVGYSLPENFNRPYLKTNLAQFWQSWHITLSTWLRTYVFIPLSRTLLRTRLGKRPNLVVFCAHMTTMLLIGLWHGITLNFALWGLWHGLGLFTQKVFSDRTRRWHLRLKKQRLAAPVMNGLGTLVTFHFVALGWTLFLLATPYDSLAFVRRLFGIP